MASQDLHVMLGSAEHEFFRRLADGSGVALDEVGSSAAFLNGDGSELVVTVTGG